MNLFNGEVFGGEVSADATDVAEGLLVEGSDLGVRVAELQEVNDGGVGCGAGMVLGVGWKVVTSGVGVNT